jgi:nucleotide-binding universal stress UspA family protein
MNPTKIMVYQDDNKNCINWTTYAARLADHYNASLTGIFIGPDQSQLENFDDGLRNELRKSMFAENSPANITRQRFTTVLEEFNISHQFHIKDAPPIISLRREARFYNLIVTGQPDHSGIDLQNEQNALAHMLIGSGRPVLIIPNGYKVVPRFDTVTIAWDGGREATRALHDSFFILQQAKYVNVISIDSHDDSRPIDIARPDEIVDLLKHMDIPAASVTVKASGKKTGFCLLEQASKLKSDLLVMGAYGHSRLREMVLGSATKEIIRTSSIPIFMSH